MRICLTLLLLLTLGSFIFTDAKTFGTSLPAVGFPSTPTWLFNYTLSTGIHHAIMHHFWIATSPPEAADTAIFQYFIDGEASPSITFTPASASGVMDPTQPFISEPFANRWMGKNNNLSAWWNNIPVPFYQSIAIRAYSQTGATLWLTVRGSENVNLSFSGYSVPMSLQPRLSVQSVTGTFAPLTVIPLAVISDPAVNGLVLLDTLSGVSANTYFMAGCHHFYSPYTTYSPNAPAYNGSLFLSTGTTDYYDSSYQFDAGLWYGETSGLTQFIDCKSGNSCTISAYHIHDSDHLLFEGGMALTWRVGDAVDNQGLKCSVRDGTPEGIPMETTINAQTWIYSWRETQGLNQASSDTTAAPT